MAFRFKVKAFLSIILGMSLFQEGISSTGEETSTTTAAPSGVKRCYKCENNCDNGLGKIEDCHPDADFFTFACYTNIVDGKPFQRGCTLDFTQGAEEDCVTTGRGNMFCFCKTDACNHNPGSKLTPTWAGTSFLLLSSVIGGNFLN